MRIVEVVPSAGRGVKLKALLNAKRRELRQRGRGTFRVEGDRWLHTTYPGSIAMEQGRDGVLVATLRPRGIAPEWQLLNAFIGYLDRHFAEDVDSVTIRYPAPATARRPARGARAGATARRRGAAGSRAGRRAPRRPAARRSTRSTSRGTGPRRR